jgi:hypothetical protein
MRFFYWMANPHLPLLLVYDRNAALVAHAFAYLNIRLCASCQRLKLVLPSVAISLTRYDWTISTLPKKHSLKFSLSVWQHASSQFQCSLFLELQLK